MYYYIGKYYERQTSSTGSTNTSYYFANGERVAKKDSLGNMYYYHLDHLGGTNVISDSSGNLIERIRYYPFGEIRDGGNEKYSFTGKEKDKQTDFYYFEARYYNPEFKHFTQADTVAPNIYDPQDLNRYAYVRNNPLKYVDPDGASAILVTWRIIDIVTEGHPEKLIPRHGNWGGPSWSGGSWDFRENIPLNDPIWKVPYADIQDYYFKQHDIGYRTGNAWGADIVVVDNLKRLDKNNMKFQDKAYATGAQIIFTGKKEGRLLAETVRPRSLTEASKAVNSYVNKRNIDSYNYAKGYMIDKYNQGKQLINDFAHKIMNFFSK